MVGPVLRQSGSLQNLFLGKPFRRVDGGDREHAPGKGAGFVEYHGVGFGQCLQIVATLDQNAAAAGAADTAEKAQRHGDYQGAGAGDHQEDQGPVEPITPQRTRQKAWQGGDWDQGQSCCGQQEQRRRGNYHTGGVVPGKAGDEGLAGGLFLAGVFHQVQNFGHGRFLTGPGHPDPQHAGQVHAAADDGIACLHIPGGGFAGQSGGIQRGAAGEHHAVQGYPLAGLHHHHGIHGHILRVHLLGTPILPLQVGNIRPDVHEGGNGLPGTAYGVVLEQLAHLVKEHDKHRFGVLRGEEGAYRGQGHEKILVEDLSVGDVADGLPQHIPADDGIGDQVQGPQGEIWPALSVDAVICQEGERRWNGNVGQQFDEDEKHRSQNNPPQHFLLLPGELAHKRGLLFSKGEIFSGKEAAVFGGLKGGASAVGLQVDDAVRLHLFADGDDLLHNGVEAVVLGVDGHFLGHEADGGIVDAVDLLDGGLHFSGAVGAVQVGEVETLLHNDSSKYILIEI